MKFLDNVKVLVERPLIKYGLSLVALGISNNSFGQNVYQMGDKNTKTPMKIEMKDSNGDGTIDKYSKWMDFKGSIWVTNFVDTNYDSNIDLVYTERYDKAKNVIITRMRSTKKKPFGESKDVLELLKKLPQKEGTFCDNCSYFKDKLYMYLRKE